MFIDACGYLQLNILLDLIYYIRQKSASVDLMTRMKLDRRRFEAAHLRYAMLTIMGTYENIKAIPMHTDVYESLQAFTPDFYECFTKKFAGKGPFCQVYDT